MTATSLGVGLVTGASTAIAHEQGEDPLISVLIFLVGVLIGIAIVIVSELHGRRSEHDVWIHKGRPERRDG